MRILFGSLGLAIAAFVCWAGIHQVPLYMASQDAYTEAQARINAHIEGDYGYRLDLSDLDALRTLPAEIAALDRLEHLLLNNTNITDLGPLAGLKNLERLELGQTPVRDLTPLTHLGSLRYLSLDKSWVHDLTPLAQMPQIEDLNLSSTAVQSLSPLLSLRNVQQLTLYRSYAHDGSQSYYERLQGTVFRLNNGTAYAQNYKPGFRYRSYVIYGRLIEKITLGGPPSLKPTA